MGSYLVAGSKILQVGVLLAVLLILPLPLGLVQPAAAQETEIRSEDFEGTFPGTQWLFVLDYESASGDDYWGPSGILAHEGSRSAYSSQVGVHSVEGVPNSEIGNYDNDQFASMELGTGDLSGYQSVTLSFWYWLLTYETFDYFAVATGTSEAAVPANSVERFRDSGVADWTRVEISIPTDTKLILFMFVSDFSVYGLGGAFVDEVSLVGQLPLNPPTAPRNLQATAGDAQVGLTWQAPLSDGGSPITNYKVYRGTAPGTAIFLANAGDVLSYTDTAVSAGQTYYYQVSVENTIGEGPRSNQASATPTAPPPDLTPIIVAVAVVAAGGTVGVLLWRRRASAPKGAPPPEKPSPAPPAAGIVCPRCGVTNPESMEFCLDCGAKLT